MTHMIKLVKTSEHTEIIGRINVISIIKLVKTGEQTATGGRCM